jgi:uncharacterized protein YndB with AHSA1/START domain
MTTTVTTQVHRIFIKATAERVWQAITDPEWNGRYGYGCPGKYELHPGGKYQVTPSDDMRKQGAPDVIVEGEVLECDPPRRLVQTWHALFSPEVAAEPPTRLTWEIAEQHGLTRVTVSHDVTEAPVTAAQVGGDIPEAGGGWSMMISDLKTLLETGANFTGS